MTGTDREDAEVVPLFSDNGDRDAPITAKRRNPSRSRPRRCKHKRTEIDADYRRLFCRDCGELVDAFDFLLKLAKEDGRWREARDAAECSARLAEQRLKDLQHEERNAKARLQRARAKERSLKAALDRLDAELRSFTPDTPKREDHP